MAIFSSGRGTKHTPKGTLGTITGQAKRSTSSHKPKASTFGRPDIGPGSKAQNKSGHRKSRGMGY
mgnify:CR=1 FL=1